MGGGGTRGEGGGDIGGGGTRGEGGGDMGGGGGCDGGRDGNEAGGGFGGATDQPSAATAPPVTRNAAIAMATSPAPGNSMPALLLNPNALGAFKCAGPKRSSFAASRVSTGRPTSAFNDENRHGEETTGIV